MKFIPEAGSGNRRLDPGNELGLIRSIGEERPAGAGVADAGATVDHAKSFPGALAVAADRRMEPLPDVPTFAESGFPTVRMDNWFGAITPAKTPADTTNQLIAWLKTAMDAPDVRQKLETQGLYSVLTCGTDFADLIRRRYAEYGEAIKQSGLKNE